MGGTCIHLFFFGHFFFLKLLNNVSEDNFISVRPFWDDRIFFALIHK